MKLKTLKDLERCWWHDKETGKIYRTVDRQELKAEAVKWIKEDYELVKNPESHKMLERWKKRFNLTEEDLQNE